MKKPLYKQPWLLALLFLGLLVGGIFFSTKIAVNSVLRSLQVTPTEIITETTSPPAEDSGKDEANDLIITPPPIENQFETGTQQEAIEALKTYLNSLYYSKDSLKDCLISDGYDYDDITYAFTQSDIDWKEQAAIMTGELSVHAFFSPAQMIRELVKRGFTQEEAEFGLVNSSVDWYEIAYYYAMEEINNPALRYNNKDELIWALEAAGFTFEQALSGVEKTDAWPD